jgi:glycine betaine/proline transport system permease protein
MTLIGLACCFALGMWAPAVHTIALIIIAVAFSLSIGIIFGVLLSRSERLKIFSRPILDVMQTMPPWVYLVPAVVLFGLGAVPALLATIIFGIPPMIRLTILAMSQIPANRLELGAAIGASPREILWKIELPSALPTLLVGVNQCVLLSLGMVVLAGLVGAGGLGSEVTRGLSRMEFGLGVRASLAIVILALIIDRVCRGTIPARFLKH